MELTINSGLVRPYGRAVKPDRNEVPDNRE
jgi:hypothetical protein